MCHRGYQPRIRREWGKGCETMSGKDDGFTTGLPQGEEREQKTWSHLRVLSSLQRAIYDQFGVGCTFTLVLTVDTSCELEGQTSLEHSKE